MNTGLLRHAVATVLTVYGIETKTIEIRLFTGFIVATVLTVYGIETPLSYYYDKNGLQKLQQCLPFTVLKQVMLNKLQSSTQSCNSAYRLRY